MVSGVLASWSNCELIWCSFCWSRSWGYYWKSSFQCLFLTKLVLYVEGFSCTTYFYLQFYQVVIVGYPDLLYLAGAQTSFEVLTLLCWQARGSIMRNFKHFLALWKLLNLCIYFIRNGCCKYFFYNKMGAASNLWLLAFFSCFAWWSFSLTKAIELYIIKVSN